MTNSRQTGILGVGILGVGRMGSRVCARLVEHGFDVRASDPAEGAAQSVASAGAIFVPDAAALAGSVEMLITALPGRAELDSAMGDILAVMRPGAIWLDLTSGDPAVSDRLASVAEGHGILPVAAGMGGGPTEAESGTLTLYVGGRDAAVERALPVLRVIGSRIERAGDTPGAAQTVKLLANLLWFGQAIAVTEALLLGTSLGVEAAALRRILPSTAGDSVFIDRYLDLLLAGDYADNFGLDRVVEELRSLRDLAARNGTPFELSEVVTRLHEEALARFGAVDGELLGAKLLEERAGRSLRA